MHTIINQVKSFFRYPETTRIHKAKVYSTIILFALLVLLLVYGRYRNQRLSKELAQNKRYTIGKTIRQYKNFRSPNPTVKYEFWVNGRSWKQFAEIPNYLHDKVQTTNGRYYVEFSSKDPANSRLLFGFPVPKNIIILPDSGWSYIPGFADTQGKE